MPMIGSIWDTSAIRRVVCEWYGVRDMPMTILTREEEIHEFQSKHPEIPADWWAVVNHASRQVLLWAKQTEDCLDFVVWDEEQKKHRLVQDVCFKDAYPTTVEWYKAIQQILQTKKVWVVRHE